MKNNTTKKSDKKSVNKAGSGKQASERKKSEAKLYNNPLIAATNIA